MRRKNKNISDITVKDVKNYFKDERYKRKKDVDIVYCPERVVQGLAIKELPKLPQIISGLSKKSISVSKILVFFLILPFAVAKDIF